MINEDAVESICVNICNCNGEHIEVRIRAKSGKEYVCCSGAIINMIDADISCRHDFNLYKNKFCKELVKHLVLRVADNYGILDISSMIDNPTLINNVIKACLPVWPNLDKSNFD